MSCGQAAYGTAFALHPPFLKVFSIRYPRKRPMLQKCMMHNRAPHLSLCREARMRPQFYLSAVRHACPTSNTFPHAQAIVGHGRVVVWFGLGRLRRLDFVFVGSCSCLCCRVTCQVPQLPRVPQLCRRRVCSLGTVQPGRRCQALHAENITKLCMLA